MEDLTESPKPQSVVYDVFDDSRVTILVEPVGVNPEAIGALQLLVYEPDGRLPVRYARPPAQREPEQAEPIVDQGPFSHGNRSWRENSEVKFGRGDTLEVGRLGEEGEHLFTWQ